MQRLNLNFLRVFATLGLSFLAAVAGTASAAQGMTSANWRLNLNVTAGATPDNSTQLGTDPNASAGWDDVFDFFNPPAIGDNYVDAYFTHENTDLGWQGVGGTYATDVRFPVETGQTLEWDNLTIATNAGTTAQPNPITVTWPGIADVPSAVQLILKDPNDLNHDGVLEYDMRAVHSFQFPAQANGSTAQYLLGVAASVVEVVPPTPLKGDVNGDGKVNVQDATLALRAAVGLIQLTADQQAAADITKDGKVNVQDATLVLRMAVGLIPAQ
jgi:hypothetical protein